MAITNKNLVKTKNAVNQTQILATSDLQYSISCTLNTSGLTAGGSVPAGTPVSLSGTVATIMSGTTGTYNGILLHDIEDIQTDSVNVAVLIFGFVKMSAIDSTVLATLQKLTNGSDVVLV